MGRRENLETLYAQLALDYNAAPEDFQSDRIVLTKAAKLPGRRAYTDKAPFFEMVTVGVSTVIMADESLHPALSEWVKGVEEPHWLLEFPRLFSLSAILSPYGYELTQTHHGYLPVRGSSFVCPPKGVSLTWLEQPELLGFYPNRIWPNALQEQENPARPDVLALAAMDGGKIIGLAGASADAQNMWQIGIDVLQDCRGKGLGTLLVRNLAAEIEKRGKLPFYYVSLSNLHSQNIAGNCGFAPAWVDVSAWKKEQ